jgi:hypothetical protein
MLADPVLQYAVHDMAQARKEFLEGSCWQLAVQQRELSW